MTQPEGPRPCVCCDEPATVGSEYAGETEREKSVHRGRRKRQLDQERKQQEARRQEYLQALEDMQLPDTQLVTLSGIAQEMVAGLRTIVAAIDDGARDYQQMSPTRLLDEQRAAAATEIAVLAQRCARLEAQLAEASSAQAQPLDAARSADAHAAEVSELLLIQDRELEELRDVHGRTIGERDTAVRRAAVAEQEAARLAEIVRLQGELLAGRDLGTGLS